MKTLKLKSKLRFLITLCSLLILGSCIQMSEHIKDEAAGMNGGFEVTKNGIHFNNRYCWVCELKNEQIIRVRAYLDSALICTVLAPSSLA